MDYSEDNFAIVFAAMGVRTCDRIWQRILFECLSEKLQREMSEEGQGR